MIVLLVASSAWAQWDSDSPAFVVEGQGSLVLEHTSVEAHVQLGLAVVDVRQTFHNPFAASVDATYLFPLPPDAAVRSMTMVCGERRIEGELLGKEEARERYEQAASEGKKAALLEQRRPNLFQQSVASLCPGEEVIVELQYVDPLHLEDGRRELVFPTTVGPRYRPGAVPEPPFTTIPAHRLDVSVTIDEGLAIGSVWSDSHDVTVDDGDDGVTTVTNATFDDLPNKDFSVAWTFGGKGTRVAAIALPPTDDEAGYLGITIEPAIVEDLNRVQGRELLFVLDESCSMRGEPFDASVATVQLAMSQMGPGDTFNLVRFSSTASSLFDEPRRNTAANVALANEWLKVFDGGGTEMTAGILHSLTMPGDPERLRLILMLTDGFIGYEDQVLARVREHLGDARLFSLGVGPSVNRYLLDRLAAEGRGDVAYHLPGTPYAETVDTFYERIAHPAMTDLRIDWGGLEVEEVYPSKIPDAFSGQPVRVVARYKGDPDAVTIRLLGNVAGEAVAVRRPLALRDTESHEALPTLWARRKIADLHLTLRSDPLRLEEEVTGVALDHHLVSAFTSLVAVEKTPSSCGPASLQVDVPSMVPRGMADESLGNVLGASGTGIGGGANASMTGLGGLGTRGIGSASSGYGTGGGDFGTKGEGGIGSVGGDPIILGSLDRSLIDEVIKRHLNQIRYCYQQALTKDPSLAGNLTIKFTIAGDGTVSAAEVKRSTLADADVGQCVVGRFLRMQFPEPSGGGIVMVSYPFVFSPN